MDEISLESAELHKVDAYIWHQFENHRKLVQYSGTITGWIRLALSEGIFDLERKVPFLMRVDSVDWDGDGIQGLQIYTNIGRIFTAQGTFGALIELAKNKHVISIESSRPMTTDYESV